MTRSQIVGDHQVNGTKTNNFVRDSFEIMHASATVWVRANLYGYCCRVGNIDILYVGLTGAANALSKTFDGTVFGRSRQSEDHS